MTFDLRLTNIQNDYEILVEIEQSTPYDAVKVAEQIYGKWFTISSINQRP